MAEKPAENSLSGYRVLDIADESGTFCGRLLADMGAAVTRIESSGRDELLDMVKGFDVLVETGNWGLDYEALAAANPRLIMASITGFGQTWPRRGWQSSDLVAQASGGWLSVTGEPERPLKLCGDQAYYTASLFAANGILLALLARRETGRGQRLDISLQECAAATLDHVLVRYIHQGEVAGRTARRYWNGAFRILPCRDGYILVSWQQHWETLVEWLASEGMAEDLGDVRWQDEQVRLDNEAHIAGVLEKWTLAHDADELVETAQLMRFPWAKVAMPAALETGEKHAAPGMPLRMGE